MMSISAWRTLVCAGLVTQLAFADQSHRSGLPDDRWVVEKQEILVRPQDIGQSADLYPEGLTRAANGDWLLAVCCAPAGKTVIMRSANGCRSWQYQGVFVHRVPQDFDGQHGLVEGMVALRSGRLVLSYHVLDQKIERTRRGDKYYVAGGNNFRFTRLRSAQWGAYSDDEGKTWHYTPMNLAPFLSADFEASSQIFESQDGTLIASFRGHLNQAELDAGLTSVGMVRSRDGGLSWGDATVLHRGQPGSGLWYNESQVIPLPDGRWLGMIRLNNNNEDGETPLTMHRTYSNDQGRSWSYPIQTRFRGGEPGLGMLNDGAIVCAQTAGRFIDLVIHEDRVEVRSSGVEKQRKLLYEVSYDHGRTWAYWDDLYRADVGSREHIGSVIIRPLDDSTAIAVYHRTPHIGVSWLGRVPADDASARSLKYPK